MQYIPIFSKLVEEFEKLPGVGSKSAQKMAYYIIAADKSVAKAFADTLIEAKQKIRCCSVCQNLTEKELCSICAGDKRNRSVICVVEKPSDVDAIERTRDYNGLYHVLHGLISPMTEFIMYFTAQYPLCWELVRMISSCPNCLFESVKTI